MKTLVLQSNHGNHRGYNREWTIRAKCESIEESQKELNKLAYYVAEKHNLDEDETKELTGNTYSFEFDLTYYYVITEEDYFTGIFDGGHMGYANRQIVNFFENTL